MKYIIDMPYEEWLMVLTAELAGYGSNLHTIIRKAIPLDDVKTKIVEKYENSINNDFRNEIDKVIKIMDEYVDRTLENLK